VPVLFSKHQAMNTYWGSRGIAPRMEVGGQLHAKAALPQGTYTFIHDGYERHYINL
jgi:hypothetical protein